MCTSRLTINNKEEGKDIPAPLLRRRLLGHLLTDIHEWDMLYPMIEVPYNTGCIFFTVSGKYWG